MSSAHDRRMKQQREQAQQNSTTSNISAGVPGPAVSNASGTSTEPPARAPPIPHVAPSNRPPPGPRQSNSGFNQQTAPANATTTHHNSVHPRAGSQGAPQPRSQDTVASLSSSMSRIQVTDTRPQLAANYFSIKIGDINVIFQYDLEITIPDLTTDSGKSGKPGHTGNVGRPTHINDRQKERIVWLVMNQLQRQNVKVKTAMATNYKTMIITSAKLSGLDFPFDIRVPYYDQFHQSPPQDNPTVFQVRIEAPQQLVLSELMNHLSRGQPSDSSSGQHDQTRTALNVIFAYRPYQKCLVQQPPTATRQTEILPTYTTSDGGKFYGVIYRNANDSATGGPLKEQGRFPRPDDGVKSILGFTRSVRTFSGFSGKLNLNINTTTALFYPSTGTVAQLIRLWAGHNGYRDNALSHHLDLFLSNLWVRTCHGNSQTGDYITSIAGIARAGLQRVPTAGSWKMAPQGPNLVQYFQSRGYGNIEPDGYVVHIGNRNRPVPFPAERLYIIPGQVVRNTSEKPTGAIRPPIINRDLILKTGWPLFYGLNSPNMEEGARAFHLHLEPNMLQVPVVRIEAPNVQYRYRTNNPQLIPGVRDSDHRRLQEGAWDLKNCSFFIPNKAQTRWTYLVLDKRARPPQFAPAPSPTCNDQDLTGFGNNIRQAFRDYGMSNFQFHPLQSHRVLLPYHALPGTRQEKELEHQHAVIKGLLENLANQGVRLVAIILPSKDQDLYSAIKRAGDVEVGVSTLCTVVFKNRPKNSGDFFANLCLKVNLKTHTDTANQSLKVKGPILTPRTMIMGIDVTHPGPNAMVGAPSIAAVVGSIDSEFAQWPVSFGPVYPDLKKDSKEEVSHLDDLVYKRVKDYFTRNNKAQPDKLIIYRDGLSEGQFNMCKDVEYAAIQRGLDKFAQEIRQPKPKVLLICAVKRHHTRLFPIVGKEHNPKLLDQKGNPLPGTMVDDLITYGYGKDFFLVSQKAIQGTARPTHYVVLKNDLDEACELRAIAQMTHNLCYLFGRATRSVSVCPPAYYADLAADRARVWVRRFYNTPKVDGRRQSYDRAIHDAEFVGRLLAEHRNLQGHMFYI